MSQSSTQDRRQFLAKASAGVVALSAGPLAMKAWGARAPQSPPDGERMPALRGAVAWFNSRPLDRDQLAGKVVLVDFWTYTCINSLRVLPYLKRWADTYERAGLVVIGVHSPEFSFEREVPNVARAVADLKVTFPVAVDSDHRIWSAFRNNYWPADYFIDAKGSIRDRHIGEGDYARSERTIRKLLEENGARGLDRPVSGDVSGRGIESAPGKDVRSPETYVGYRRAERFSSPDAVARDAPMTYRSPPVLALNEWGLTGLWSVGAESAVAHAPSSTIRFRFHSRDLHLVIVPPKEGAPARFMVTLDGAVPREHHGIDVAPDGTGEVRVPRLYQLIRQQGRVADRTAVIEFRDPGIQVVAFTFG